MIGDSNNFKVTSSAEEIHQGRINLTPKGGKDLRLFIDLDICAGEECESCRVECSYFYHPVNNGMISLAELAGYYLVCRRCEEPHCVNACPVEALEQQPEKDNLLIRHNMLCIGCRSCSHACPYGTIYPEYVPLLVNNCDFCLDRREEENEPLCIKTCPYGALRLEAGALKLGENTFLVGDHLIVHSTHWNREKA